MSRNEKRWACWLLTAIAIGTIIGVSPASAQNCTELRRACEMKDQLGERGRGNCRAYREQCTDGGDQQQQVDCQALRIKCMFRDELGERGRGNCRAFRQFCSQQ